MRRQRPRQMRNRFEALRRQHLLEMQSMENAPDWPRYFVPEAPSAEDVDCNIEVEVLQVIGGRCVRLGGAGRMAVCQSGMYLDVHNEECEHILASRETNSPLSAESPQPFEQLSQISRTVPENSVAQNGGSENGASSENVLSETQHAAEGN